MLCGVPVIAYDIENHSEVVIDGYTGFLVPFRNIKALSKAIVSVANDYEEAKLLGLRGQELARVIYDKDWNSIFCHLSSFGFVPLARHWQNDKGVGISLTKVPFEEELP
jgi:hypothetical protein